MLGFLIGQGLEVYVCVSIQTMVDDAENGDSRERDSFRDSVSNRRI